MNVRKERQNLIISLIESEPISTQDELIQHLREQGYDVTQATISRDIKELKLIKVVGPEGKSVYSVHNTPSAPAQFNSILEGAVVSTDYAMNTCVIKTHAGMANAACASLDAMHADGVLGTIAGDDTIFVLCRNEQRAADICDLVKTYIRN